MDIENNPPTVDKVMIPYNIIIPLLVILVLVMIVGSGYLIFRGNSNNSNTAQAPSKSSTRSNTDFFLSPNKDGVTKALVYYTLLGRIQSIQSSENGYIITLTSQVGESLLSGFLIKTGDLTKVELVTKDSNTSPIAITNLKNGDLIGVDINGDLKKNTYQASVIYKYSEQQ